MNVSRDNDPDVHTNRQVFSCGSLAPKLRRAAGCMDHSFRRPTGMNVCPKAYCIADRVLTIVTYVAVSEPWEATDGAIHLLAEVAARRPEGIVELLPVFGEVVRYLCMMTLLPCHTLMALGFCWVRLTFIAMHTTQTCWKHGATNWFVLRRRWENDHSNATCKTFCRPSSLHLGKPFGWLNCAIVPHDRNLVIDVGIGLL